MPAASDPEPKGQLGRTGSLEGFVDAPSDGATVKRSRVTVSGWHSTGRRPAVAVAIAVGGELMSVAIPGTVRRPDVAVAYGDPLMGATGWSAALDLTNWSRASARLDVVVWPSVESAPVWLPPITVVLVDDDAPAPSGALDAPASERALERGVTSIAGWAFDRDAPIDRVEIVVGDGPRTRARLGLVRDDLVELLGVPHARLAGFEATVDLADLASDRQHVRITVTGHPMRTPPFIIADGTYPLTYPGSPSGPEQAEVQRHADLRERTRQALDRLRPEQATASRELDLLVFTHDLGLGGAQLWLAEYLERSGAGRAFPCTVISPRPGTLLRTFERLGIAVHVTNGYPVESLEAYEGAVAELAALSSRNGHTATLVNSFCSFIGADVAARLRLPCVWAIHESYRPALLWAALYPPGHVDRHVRAAAIGALQGASALLFVAEATRQLFLSATDPDRTVVVRYGVDIASVDRARGDGAASLDVKLRARGALGLPAAATVLLLVGASDPRKAQTTTAEAFARVAAEFPDAMLAFVGLEPGPYTDALRGYVNDVGLSTQCRIFETVDDTSVWYLAADALVCASDVESLPRTVLEAMCFEIPVLATSVFGLPELITDGETGWLFEPRSVGDAEAALRRVLSLDVETRLAVAAAASEVVRDLHSSREYVATVSRLLRALALDPTARIADALVSDSRHF
jgi:glycosyltransferase involved in cell wall biosynthesis